MIFLIVVILFLMLLGFAGFTVILWALFSDTNDKISEDKRKGR